MPQQPQKASAKRRRNTLRLSGVAICRVGDVAAKEFICAFAAESYGHVLAAERGKKPNGERPGVGERFIGVVREFLNGRGQIQRRVDIKLVVFGVVSRGNVADVRGFVEGASGERDRKRFYAGSAQFACVVENRGGIDAAAQPDSQRHIGNQVIANGSTQQTIELLLRAFQGLLFL